MSSSFAFHCSPSISISFRGNKIYEPPRFMTINQCIAQLLEIEEQKQGNGNSSCYLNIFKSFARMHPYLSFSSLSIFNQSIYLSGREKDTLNALLFLVCSQESLGIGLARVGQEDQKIVSGLWPFRSLTLS